jgi:MoxR-like ATPase
VTVPELGTIRAAEPPIVIITTNRTREIHDALKRRCLYHWVDYPARRANWRSSIARCRMPMSGCRRSGLFRAETAPDRPVQVPGVAETIDWAGALTELDKVALDPETVSDTIGVLLKYQDDIARIGQGEGRRILDEVKAELAAAE